MRLRIYEQRLPTASSGALPFPCFGDLQLTVELSSTKVAGTAVFAGRSSATTPAEGQVVGQAEGQPIAVVAARVPAGTRKAVVRFVRGHIDMVRPLADGWVVLASAVAIPDVPVPGLNQGSTVGRMIEVDSHGHSQTVSIVNSNGPLLPGCVLPGGVALVPTSTTTTLPAPTGPPPRDAAAARAAVEAAYRAVFNGTLGSPQVAQNLQGGAPPLTPAARAQLQQEYGSELGKLTVRFNSFEFLNATKAALSFDLLYNGQPITATSTGDAVLQDGRWKVTRDSLCQVVARANIACS